MTASTYGVKVTSQHSCSRIEETDDGVADIGRRRYPAGPAQSHRREEGADLANEHFHPEIEPYRTGHLQVDDLHTLYYEECGTPDGLPMLFVHGGPGAGCTTTDRRFFDSDRFRTVLFDQRGCGRSTPWSAHGPCARRSMDRQTGPMPPSPSRAVTL